MRRQRTGRLGGRTSSGGRRRVAAIDVQPMDSEPDVLATARAVTQETLKLRAQSAALSDAHRALREANQRFADLYDFVPIPYLIVSPLGLIHHINQSGLQMLGGEREWVVGRPLIAYIDRNDLRRVLDEVLGQSTGTSKSVRARLRAWDGMRTVQMVSRRYRHDDSSGALHIAIVDLSEIQRLEDGRRRAEQESQRSQEAERVARAANEAKDEFLAMLSHELRTPLTPILAAADSLVARGTLSAGLRAKLDIIRRNVKVEAQLIDDLLDVARIAKKTLEVQRRSIDVHRVVSDLLEGWVAPLQERQITLNIRLEADTHWVHGDPSRLGQVFRNVIANASKFTEAGGRITVTSEAHDGRIRVSIHDTGEGMTAEQLDALFVPFQPSGERVSRHGLGLGLVISQAIVAAHDGKLEVWSRGLGEGTTVRVELPIVEARPADADLPVDAERPVTEPRQSSTANVLLVEDDHDSADMLAMLLSLEGFQVRVAASLHGALNLVDHCDVIVSDIALPDGSGLDLMRQVRASGSAIRGIALSGYGSAQDVTRSIQAGFEEHLTKPVDLERLVAAVRRLTIARPQAPTVGARGHEPA